MYDNNENLSMDVSGNDVVGDSSGDLLQDAETDIETVSSGDAPDPVPSVPVQNTSETLLVPAADVPDYSETLAHIDAMLVLIVFLIIFDWCCRRIKNIVRMFTGRNLK